MSVRTKAWKAGILLTQIEYEIREHEMHLVMVLTLGALAFAFHKRSIPAVAVIATEPLY